MRFRSRYQIWFMVGMLIAIWGLPYTPEVVKAQSSKKSKAPQIHWIVDGEKAKTPPAVSKIFDTDTLSMPEDRAAVKTAILEHYWADGFLSAQIDSLRLTVRNQRRDIYGMIYRGCRYRIGKLKLEGIEKPHKEQLDLFIKRGTSYQQSVIESEIDRIIRYFEDKGYPLVKVNISRIDRDRNQCRVDITVQVDTGKKMRVDGLLFPPINNVDPEYIRKASGVPDSALITPERLQSIRQRLQSTGFFQTVGDPQIVVREDQQYLQIPLKERNPNLFDLVVGYVPNTGGGGTVVGDGQLRIRNILWPGSDTQIEFERQRRLVTKLNFGFHRNWIMGVPLGGGVDIRFLQQDTSYQVREISLTGMYDLNTSTSISGRLRRKVAAGNKSLQRASDVLDATSTYGGLGITYRHLNDQLNPSNGIELTAELLTGIKRITDERAGEGGIDSRVSQRIFEFDLQSYFPVWRRHVLTPRVHGYFLDAAQMTESDLVRFGGAQSLRGYREDQFRASRLVWGDLEYRYLIDPATYGFVFGAAGYYTRPQLVTESTGERATRDWLFSWGLGFSYNTGLGRLRFSYAISPKDALNNGKVHFGIVTSL